MRHDAKLIFTKLGPNLVHASMHAITRSPGTKIIARPRTAKVFGQCSSSAERIPESDAKVARAFNAVNRSFGAAGRTLSGITRLLYFLSTRASFIIGPVK